MTAPSPLPSSPRRSPLGGDSRAVAGARPASGCQGAVHPGGYQRAVAPASAAGVATSAPGYRATAAAHAQGQVQAQAQVASASARASLAPAPAPASGMALGLPADPSQPGTPEPEPSSSGTLPRVLPGRGPHLAQVVSLQVAATLVAVSLHRSPPVRVAMEALAATIGVLVLTPWQGAWLYQRVRLRAAFLARRKTVVEVTGATAGGGPRVRRVAGMPVLLGEMVTDGGKAATISHPEGIAAVVECHPDSGSLFAPESSGIPLPWEILPDSEGDPLPVTVQTLVEIGPISSCRGDRGRAVDMYRELTAGEVPALRRSWVVVRVHRTPDAHTDPALEPSLGLALKRVRRALRAGRLATQVLDSRQMPQVVAGAARSGPVSAREGWLAVHYGSAVHVTGRISRWPVGRWSLDRIALRLPVEGVVVSLAASHHPGASARPEPHPVLIRLIASDQGVASAGWRQLTAMFAEVGGAVERLDGRQGRGLVATLPWGGVPV